MSDDVQPLDCGNNPCWFATSQRGMRTQGKCRCLSNIVPSAKTSELRTLELRLRKTIAAHFMAGRESK